MNARIPPVAVLLLALATASSALAAQVREVRVTRLAKDGATLEVDLDAPGAVSVSYGEAPMQWSDTASSEQASSHHVVALGPLSPDQRYFYQVSVDGAPAGDVLTFQSGRSWVTRRAVILATADVPDGGPAEAEDAQRLYAEEADILLALGGDGGRPDDFARLHRRSLAERLVVEVPAGGDAAPVTTVADVAIATIPDAEPSAAALERAKKELASSEGACWRILATAVEVTADGLAALDRAAAEVGADVVLARGETPSLVRTGDRLRVVLTNPRAGGTAPACHVRLAFTEGKLEAKLWRASGEVQGESLARTCLVPGLKNHARASDETGDVGDVESTDLEAPDAGCDTH